MSCDANSLAKLLMLTLALGWGLPSLTAVARAQDADASATVRDADADAGRVEFNYPAGATPAVEVDLPAGLFRDVVGLGDAAVAGVAEALLEAQVSDESAKADVKLATDQLAAIRAIVDSLQGAVGEVRVRVYADADEQGVDAGSVASNYAKQLEGSAWSKIVHVRDDDDGATVFLMRQAGAIRGVFVVATDGHELVLVNVLCDVSPERVKQITKQAASIGLELGGEEALKELVEDVRGSRK